MDIAGYKMIQAVAVARSSESNKAAYRPSLVFWQRLELLGSHSVFKGAA